MPNEVKIEAEFVLEDNDDEIVKTVYESIKGEAEKKKENLKNLYTNLEMNDKRLSFVDLVIKGNRLSVTIRGEDITRVRAATNTWLRLLKIAKEMVEVCDSHGF